MPSLGCGRWETLYASNVDQVFGQAFGEPYRKIALDEVDASDPLINATLPR